MILSSQDPSGNLPTFQMFPPIRLPVSTAGLPPLQSHHQPSPPVLHVPTNPYSLLLNRFTDYTAPPLLRAKETSTSKLHSIGIDSEAARPPYERQHGGKAAGVTRYCSRYRTQKTGSGQPWKSFSHLPGPTRTPRGALQRQANQTSRCACGRQQSPTALSMALSTK